MIKKWLLFLVLLHTNVFAETYHFVSIEGLVEQRIGAIVLPQIYQKLGLEITITPLPGKRAQYQASSGVSDGEIMRIYTYGQENPSEHRVPTPYYYLETMAFINKNSGIKINSKADLAKYSLVKVRGVKHTNNITQGLKNVTDVSSTAEMMTLLERNMVDVALTNTNDGEMVIKKLQLTNIVPSSRPLATLKLFHYIHDNHKELVPKIDKIIKEMTASGELAQIIKKAEKTVTTEFIN